MMLKLLESDVYDLAYSKLRRVSIANLYYLIIDNAEHKKTHVAKQRIAAVRKAISMLTGKEQELVFRRFIQGTSFRMLQQQSQAGGLNTPVQQVAALRKILRAYILYYLEADHRIIMLTIHNKLGKQAARVANL